MTETVAIAGGGLAGLVAARRLAESGADVTLYERRDDVGGRVRSVREDGFVFDRGFQVLFTGYPAVQRELELYRMDLREFAPGATIARPGKRSTLADPFRDPTAAPASLVNREVTTGDKLRTLLLRADLARKPWTSIFTGPDETIRAYCYRRGFSPKFVGNFVAPFYGGITLDRSLGTSRRVFEYTFKALSAGESVVPAEGMGAIPEQLAARAERAGATIETGAHVEAVEADGDAEDGSVTLTVDGEAVEADAAVVATDPRAARDLTGIESIPTEARSCVTQWYAGDGDLDVGRRLLLNAIDDEPNQVVDHTAVAPAYAPEGTTLLSATFPGVREEDDEELAETTRSTLDSWYRDRRFDDLELVHTDRIEFAQFAQPPGIHETLPDVRDPEGPVYLAGDYCRWSSIQGAMDAGRDAARAIGQDRGIYPR